METTTKHTANYSNIKFFNGLNALRFFAAFLVVAHHNETIKAKHGLISYQWLSFFRNGTNAVVFFFVLSGFLITYLLLKEQKATGDTHVKLFYLKRVLRIWPLYFLLIIIGTILLPLAFNILHINYEMPYTLGQTWPYFVFFVPGLVTFYYGHHFLEPLWSIGVEEVFYLIWAPLFKVFKKHILALLLTVIVIKIILMVLCQHTITNPLFGYIVDTFKIEAMAVGGLGAYFLFHFKKPLQQLFIFNKASQITIFTLCIVYIFFNINIQNSVWNAVFNTPILSGFVVNFMFLYIILCISVAENSLVKLKSNFFNYLGEISYGIYMYHMLVIFCVIQFCKNFILQLQPVVGQGLYYILVLAGTIIVASLSKRFFEDYFLNIKTKIEQKIK